MVYRIIEDAKIVEEAFEAKNINDADKVAGRLLSTIRRATDKSCEIVELREVCESKLNGSTTQIDEVEFDNNNHMEMVSSNALGAQIKAKNDTLVLSICIAIPKHCNIAAELTALENATSTQSIVKLKDDCGHTNIVKLVMVTKVLPNNMKLGDLINMRIAISNIIGVCTGKIFDVDCEKVISEAIKVFNANGNY